MEAYYSHLQLHNPSWTLNRNLYRTVWKIACMYDNLIFASVMKNWLEYSKSFLYRMQIVSYWWITEECVGFQAFVDIYHWNSHYIDRSGNRMYQKCIRSRQSQNCHNDHQAFIWTYILFLIISWICSRPLYLSDNSDELRNIINQSIK